MTATLDARVTEFAPKVGVKAACAAFAVNERSYHHRRQRDEGRLVLPPPAQPKPRAPHPASLTDEENQHVVDVLCSERFADMAPAQVYTTLLDEGTYLCSERQMYRILEAKGLVRERRRGGHQRAGSYGVPRLEADAPNKVWTWDIERHEAPANRAVVKGHGRRLVAAS